MKVDVIVLGTGQAGVPLALRLARAGRRVLVVERGELGGTCTNIGCTPTKTMIASAQAAHVARTAERLGVRVGEVRVDLGAIVDRKDAVIRRWRGGVRERFVEAGERLTLLEGHGRFVGEREIEVNGERHTAEIVILDVGARHAVPPVPGLDGVGWLDNRRVMELRELPRHLLVMGGGYVGCEFSQMFRRFGSDVTIVDRTDHLLAREDPEISSELEAVFRKEGIALELGVGVQTVGKAGGEVLLKLGGGKEIRGSHLLVAVGRRPNTDDLGADAGGVRLDAQGFIAIDDYYRTSAPGVYAVGDATGEPQFTHVAWDDHRILFDLLTNRSTRGRAGRLVPYTAFTDPQVAGVGLTEKEARAQGVEYELASMPFGEIARAVELDEPAGILKVLFAPQSDTIIGAAIVGAEAGELIHIFITLMQAKASPRAIVDAEFVHPTFAEGVQSVVMKLKRYALS